MKYLGRLALGASLLAGVIPPSTSVLAEEPYVTWAKSSAWGFGPPGSFALTPQGEMLVSTIGGGFADQRMLKFDAQGRVVSSNLVSALPGRMTSIAGVATDPTGATYIGGLGGEDSNAFSVIKCNPNGEVVWVCRETAPLSAYPYNTPSALAPDTSGNVWVAGVSNGRLTLGSYSFGEGGGPVLCKLDHNGQVQLVRRIEHQATGGTTGAQCYEVVVDRANNVIISGWLAAGSADFGGTTVYPGELQAQPWGDTFVAKYDVQGNLLWVRLSGVTDARGGYLGMSIAADRQGNIYMLESGLRLGKLDPGGTLLWEKEFSGAILSQRQGISLDANEQPVFTGEFSGSISLDGIVLTSKATSWEDLFIAKADSGGQILWAMRGGGSVNARGYGVLCNPLGHILLAGEIQGTAASIDGVPLPPRPGNDGYGTVMLAKISEQPRLGITNFSNSTTLVYPAKASNYVLEATTAVATSRWSAVTNAPTITGRDRRVRVPLTGDASFFRLRKP